MPNYDAHQNGKDTRYRATDTDDDLGEVIGTRYPLDVDAVLRGMDSQVKQALIRSAVRERLEVDGLL